MRGMEDDLDGAAFLGCSTMGGGVQEINAPAIPSALTHDKNRLFISKTSSVICRPTFAVLLYISSWTNSTHLKSTTCAPFSSRLSGMFIFQARVKNIGGLRWCPRTDHFRAYTSVSLDHVQLIAMKLLERTTAGYTSDTSGVAFPFNRPTGQIGP